MWFQTLSWTQQLLPSHSDIKATSAEVCIKIAVISAQSFLQIKVLMKHLDEIQLHHHVVPIKSKVCIFLFFYFYFLPIPAMPDTHTHTLTNAHMYTLCHTCCHCVTHSGCEADTCSDMMVSVEVVTLAVCRLPQRELIDLGEEGKRERNRSLLSVRGWLCFYLRMGDRGSAFVSKGGEKKKHRNRSHPTVAVQYFKIHKSLAQVLRHLYNLCKLDNNWGAWRYLCLSWPPNCTLWATGWRKEGPSLWQS